MSKAMVSWFNQFPEYNGRQIEIRGQDGYFSAKDMSAAMGKRFDNWNRTKFAKELLDELSLQSGLPIDSSDLRSQSQTPLIDYVRGGQSGIFLHPYVAMSYAMADPRFQARINIWIIDLLTLGTVNPHVLRWTQEEFQRGLKFNRDDIADMYN